MRISKFAQRLAGLFAVTLLSLPGLAGAAPVTFTFEADIVSVGDRLHPIKPTSTSGQRLSGRITFDSAASPTLIDETFALYQEAVTDLSLSIEQLGLAWSGGTSPRTYSVLNDRNIGGETTDRFVVGFMPIVGPSVGEAGVIMSPLSFLLTLADHDSTVFDSLEPPTAIDLSAFETREARIVFQGMIPDSDVPGGYRTFQQFVDARLLPPDSANIPEPAALAMLGISLAGLGLARWKKRCA